MAFPPPPLPRPPRVQSPVQEWPASFSVVSDPEAQLANANEISAPASQTPILAHPQAANNVDGGNESISAHLSSKGGTKRRRLTNTIQELAEGKVQADADADPRIQAEPSIIIDEGQVQDSQVQKEITPADGHIDSDDQILQYVGLNANDR